MPQNKTKGIKEEPSANPDQGRGHAASAVINPSCARSQEMDPVAGPGHFLWVQHSWTPACQLIPSKKMVSMISLAADECVSSPHNARGVVFKSEVKQLLGLGTRVLSLASYELEQVE